MRGLFYVVVVGGAALVALLAAAAAVWFAARVVRSYRRRRDELARQDGRWEVYVEPRVANLLSGDPTSNWEHEIGLVQVAHTSAGREELQKLEHARVPGDAPEWEIAIETDRARGRATVLNDALDAADELAERRIRGAP